MAIDPKALEASSSYALSLTQTAFVIIAGSIATLVGTSYLRPQARWIRSVYFLFVPGWISLAASIYYGITVQRQYVAFLWTGNNEIPKAMNQAAVSQITFIQTGLSMFAIWMLVYLSWWILSNQVTQERG